MELEWLYQTRIKMSYYEFLLRKKFSYQRRDVESKRKSEIDGWMDILCYLFQYIHMVPNNNFNQKLQFFDVAFLFSRSIRVNFVVPALTTSL